MEHTETSNERYVSRESHIRQTGPQSGDTSVSGGFNFQGNFAGLTVNSATAGQPEYSGHFSESSLAPVKKFVPRPELLYDIRARLCNGPATTATKTLVVWGFGGTGKTQLLLKYIDQYRSEYKATFWIEAGERQSLERDFVNLYHTLYGVHNISITDKISVGDAVTAVKSWFSGRQGPWLIVFDGADSIDDEKARGYLDIKRFIPQVPSMHVVVTTRSGVAQEMTQLGGIHVDVMEKAQATELFYRCSEVLRNNDNTKEIEAIVKELGYLALAITLGGTYVKSTHRLRSHIQKYLPEYRHRRGQLLGKRPISTIDQYTESVMTTWETSYQAIAESDCSEAARLLSMLSFLSADDIFPTLLESPTSSKYKVEECFTMLERYVMVRWKGDQESYTMHKLVHAWGFERLDENQQQELSVAALKLIRQAIRECNNQPKDKQRLVPHIMANHESLAHAGQKLYESREGVVDEIESIGIFLGEIGRFADERVLQEFVLNVRQERLGKEDPGTIRAMNNLATVLHDQGQLDEAAEMKKEVLEKGRRILGEEHPGIIMAMNNLATTLHDQGQLDEAARMMKEVLEKSRRILGEEHPDTIMAMHNHAITLGNLANMLHDQEQLDEAAEMKKEVLEKSRRILGEEHPDTIGAMNSLAATLSDQTNFDEAISFLEIARQKLRETQNEHHPVLHDLTHNLAICVEDKSSRATSTSRNVHHDDIPKDMVLSNSE